MADDPIVKFFREDLTQAEEQALSDKLASSSEEAVRFGQHAEASYRYYGLPEPEWRGGGPPSGFFPRPGFRPVIWLSVALLAGFLGWFSWHILTLSRGKGNGAVPAQQKITSQAQTPPGLPDSNEAVPETMTRPSESTALPDKPSGFAQEQSPGGQSGAFSKPTPPWEGSMPLTAVSTPVNVTAQPHHPHSNLEVMIRRSSPGQVTVEVLNPSGTPVVLLYQGLLEPGNWAFDWNGRLGDGSPAPPGTYHIQVQSGSILQSRSVVLRQK
jgi:hypothetical protein